MNTNSVPEGFLTYDARLNADRCRALDQGGWYFEEKSDLFFAFRRLTDRLNAMHVSYAVIGGLAMFEHGYRRFTHDVDLLVTRETLERICLALDGEGYYRSKSTQLLDAETGVRIDFLISDPPGTAPPAIGIAKPDPATVAIFRHGVPYVPLPMLVSLKLTHGLLGGMRLLRHLADVMEMLKTIDMPREMAEELHPTLRPTFLEYWHVVADMPKEELDWIRERRIS